MIDGGDHERFITFYQGEEINEEMEAQGSVFDQQVMEERAMYRQIIPTLLVILGLASWADTGFAVSTQRAARPVIASTTVDADNNIMVVSGQHFGGGSPVVAVGDRVLRVQSHSDNEVVVEIPAGLAPGSYRLIVTTTGPDKQSSEPFSSALFAAR